MSVQGTWGLHRGKKSKRISIAATLIVTFVLGAGSMSRAEHKVKDQDCLACHSDATLTKDVNGKQASLFVDAAKFKHSVHG